MYSFIKRRCPLHRLKIVNTADGHCTFILDPAAPSDAGLYKIVARNPLGQVNRPEGQGCQMVYFRPKILVSGSNHTIAKFTTTTWALFFK
jgi:hypothetical protein